MKIDRIELFHVQAAPPASIDTVLVRMICGDHQGWGEACPGAAPRHSSEFNRGAFIVLEQHLAPALTGQTIDSGDALQLLLSGYQGNAAAKSALDCAWWNLQAAATGKTLAALIGAGDAAILRSMTVDVLPTIDELITQLTTLQNQTDLFVLKFRPGWDEQMLRAVRQVLPVVPLAVDCDGLCKLAQREMFYRLDDFMLRWIEQPFDCGDLVAPAIIQQDIRTTLCLHQSVTSLERLEQILDLQSAKAIRLDISLLGGITPTLAVQRLAMEADLLQTVGHPAVTREGAAASAVLAQLPGITLPCDIIDLATRPTAESLIGNATMQAKITC
jgi:O-succinylbenzoate synthase